MKSAIFLFFLVFSIFSIYAGTETASIEVVTSSSTYSDFNDVVPEVDASAHYHWFFVCGAHVWKWNGSSWVQKSKYYEIGYDYPYDGQDHNWSVTDEPVPAEDLGQFGNGEFQLRFRIDVNSTYDTDIMEFEVDDVVAPDAPTLNDIVEPYLGHPQLSWNKPTIDTEKYKVYRTGTDYDKGTWNHIATPTTASFEDEDVICGIPDATVSYKIKAVDYEDNISAYSNSESIVAHFKPVVQFSPKASEVPKSFSLSQNYPNPFNPETNIIFDLPEDNFVNLVVYNISGEKVVTLINEQLPTGSYTAKFDGSVLSSGVYIYKIQAGSFSQIKRMLLIK
jgi:hypothetical protein